MNEAGWVANGKQREAQLTRWISEDPLIVSTIDKLRSQFTQRIIGRPAGIESWLKIGGLKPDGQLVDLRKSVAPRPFEIRGKVVQRMKGCIAIKNKCIQRRLSLAHIPSF
jgi:hypothetical protein